MARASQSPYVEIVGSWFCRAAVRATTLAALALPAAGCTQEASYGGIDITEAPLSRTLRSEALIRKASSAVVVVETDVGRGMGFVIDPAGYEVTNRHVVEDADHIEGIVFPGRDPSRMYESVRIEYIDPLKDLALLHVHSKEPLPYLPLATRDVEPVSRYLAHRDPVVLLERGEDEARLKPGLVVRSTASRSSTPRRDPGPSWA